MGNFLGLPTEDGIRNAVGRCGGMLVASGVYSWVSVFYFPNSVGGVGLTVQKIVIEVNRNLNRGMCWFHGMKR